MDTRMGVKRIISESLYLDLLPRVTRRAFLYCTKLSFLKNTHWYLAGGTALALQAGHRQSVDLDFFIPQIKIKITMLERKLLETKYWSTTYIEEGTLYGTLMDAKISFIAYPFFIPSSQMFRFGNIRILVPSDIAAMKIVAISQRGRKRDFVDLYWYCIHRGKLADVINRALLQYPGQEHNLPHILKSLTYFTDAESDPMPKLFFKATWQEIKKYFQKEAPRLAKEFLGLD